MDRSDIEQTTVVDPAGVTNRVAVLAKPGTVVIEEHPVPVIGPREVLIRVSAVGVCGSDVHYYEHGRIGEFVVRAPLVLGHECAGRVVAVGSDVTKHAVGDRVAVEPGVPCGRCRECRSGRYNLCPEVRFLATPPIDGAFAEYLAIEEDFAFTLPEQVSDEVGALIEPLSVGLWACRKARVRPGERVLITGAGPIGLLTLQVARAFGATYVEVSDPDERRLAMAQRAGAARTFRPEEEPAEADVLIECSGAPAALQKGIAALRPAGIAVLVGMGADGMVQLPVARIQARELWVTGTFRYANTYPVAIQLITAGLVDPQAIVTAHYGLQETERALQDASDGRAGVKAIVHPHGAPDRTTT